MATVLVNNFECVGRAAQQRTKHLRVHLRPLMAAALDLLLSNIDQSKRAFAVEIFECYVVDRFERDFGCSVAEFECKVRSDIQAGKSRAAAIANFLRETPGRLALRDEAMRVIEAE